MRTFAAVSVLTAVVFAVQGARAAAPASPTPVVSVSGSLTEGIGQRALRRGGETLVFHVAGLSAFSTDVEPDALRRAVRDATFVADDGPFGWNAQKAVLFGANATVEVSRNRKTLKVVLAPAPAYNTTALERVQVTLPSGIMSAEARLPPTEFFVLPSTRLAVHQTGLAVVGDRFELRIDGGRAAAALSHPDRAKFVRGTDCDANAEGIIVGYEENARVLSALMHRGAERYTLCYVPSEDTPETATNSTAVFVAADGAIAVAGPRDYSINGAEGSVVSADSRVTLEFTGYSLTDEDTVVVRPSSQLTTCESVPVATLEQVDVVMSTSSRTVATVDTREAGDYLVCYLRSGSDTFVQIPNLMKVVGSHAHHDSLTVDGNVALHNNLQTHDLCLLDGGVLHAESHHINVSTFRWEGGEVNGYGAISIRNGGNISAAPKTINFEIVNHGRLVVYLSQITFTGNGRISNNGHLTIVVAAPNAALIDATNQRQLWQIVSNNRHGTISIKTERKGNQLHSHVPISNIGTVEIDAAHLWIKRFASLTESTTRVKAGGQLIVSEYVDITGRLEAHDTAVVALAGEIRFSRSRVACSNGGSIAITVVPVTGNTVIDTMAVEGSCRVFVQGLREVGQLQVQGYSTFGPNTTFGLSNVAVTATTVATIVAHGTVICNATSVTFGDHVMLSAFLRAIFFGDGASGRDPALLVPQYAPANATLTIPTNASLILLDVNAGSHATQRRAGPHLCAQYIVIPVHVVLHGEVMLWGCATMPFGGKHTGVARNATFEAIASLTEYALCQLTTTGSVPQDQLSAIVPPDVCVPIFPQDAKPVSGLLLSGSHVVDPAPGQQKPSMALDVLHVNQGKLSAAKHFYVNLARELLISDTAALSLVKGARVIVPYANIAGLLEIDAEFPTDFDGDVALRGPIDISIRLDECKPALHSTGVITIHPGAELDSPDLIEGDFGSSAAVMRAQRIVGRPPLGGGSFPEGTEVTVSGGVAMVRIMEDAPPARLRVAALGATLAVCLAILALHIGRVGPQAFAKELTRTDDIPLHITWPHFSAFTANVVLVAAYCLEAMLLAAVAFHPLLLHPPQLDGLVQSFNFLFGLHTITDNTIAWSLLAIVCVVFWALAWLPLAGARVFPWLERFLSQNEDNGMYAVQLLFQFHTFAAWAALVLYIPVVSTLLDAPMCALVLTRKAGCEHMAPYAPFATAALGLFLILAPLSGTVSKFAFCHPTYSNSVDLRQKRTSTYVLCLAQTMIAVGWKVNGHDLASSIGVSAIGLMALFAVHLFTQPCAYGNVNLFRQLILSWPFAATVIANVQYFRGALQQACVPVDPVYVAALAVSFIAGVFCTVYYLRRAGQRANQLEAIINPGAHRELNVLRELWSNIEAERMRLYNTPDTRQRGAINLRVQELRLKYLQQLQRCRHEQERTLAEYYLGSGAQGDHGSSSSLGTLDSIPMREAAKKEVTHEDIEQLTQAQMASCTEGPVLGRGTYGVVHMAMLPGGKLVALKVVQVQKRHKSESIAAVRREVDVLRTLKHPNIIQFHGCHVNRREIYIFMELATNGSLTQLARKFGQLSERNIRHYTRQMLSGLRYLHDRGIVHRDIKGENILIDGNGVAKLGDFGCSKALAEAANHSQQGCASLVGSPYWMAPEVIRSEAYGTKADVWSLGCTVVEMLNGGRPPWNETFDNVYSAMFFIGNSNGLPTSIPDDITPDCESFLNRCFERDAAARASVAELLEHPWMGGDLSSDSSPTEPEGTMMRRGWSELFESDSEGPASRGNTVPRQPTDSLMREASMPIDSRMHYSSTTDKSSDGDAAQADSAV